MDVDRVRYRYVGLMAPVFTSFLRSNGSVCAANIDAYAAHLRAAGVGAVLVNGTTGEGPCLGLDERLQTAKVWREACSRHGISMMLQIGGASMSDVLQMAAEAHQLAVDGVLVLPDLYFRPKSVHALVEYCRTVAAKCPELPVLYYHIPSMTGVNLNMPEFLDAAEREIPNFDGLKYTSSDLEMGIACLREGRSVFLGSDTLLFAALVAGFSSACLTTLNIWPQLSLKIEQLVKSGTVDGLKEARELQMELTRRVGETLRNSGDWVQDMKLAMDRELSAGGMKLRLGTDVRRPAMN